MNLFEDKAYATASMRSILGHHGKLAFDLKELPKCEKSVRVNALGFTLTNQFNDMLPYDSGDIYIGRKWNPDGTLAINDFVMYSITDLDESHYLYVTSTQLDEYHQDIFGKYYAYVNNHKNYHGMWFRATIEEYKANNPDWALDTDQTFKDLKPYFDAHYSLSKNLGINRFITEMNAMEDFYCWAGFLNTTDKSRYN